MIKFNSFAIKIAESKKVDQLKRKIQEKQGEIKEEDLKPLLELCCCDNVNAALMACDDVVYFVKYHNLSITQITSWFVSSMPSTKNISCFVKAISDLLILRVQHNEWETYYNSSDSLQHPFNLILQRDESSWPIIEFHMKFIFSQLNEKRVFSMFKPVFIYSLWSPSTTVNDRCKRSLWKYLVSYVGKDIDFVVRTLCWVRLEKSDCILDVNYFLNHLNEQRGLVAEWNVGTLMSLMFADAACNLAINGFQPESSLDICISLLEKYPLATDVILLMFAQRLHLCPITYLHLFIQSSIEIIKMNEFSTVSIVWMLIAALLPWLYQPSQHSQNISHASEAIFTIAEKTHVGYSRKSYMKELLEDQFCMQYIVSNWDCFWSFAILRKMESCSASTTVSQLKKVVLTKEDVEGNYSINLFISGILLENNNNVGIQRSCLNLLMKNNPGLQFPLILYLLSRTSHPELQLALLYNLPLVAEDESNMAPIFSTVESLSLKNNPVLDEITVILYLKLWKVKKRCYAHLSEIIQKHKVKPQERSWNMDVVTAVSIREICSFEPSTYGEEWLPLLSDIINRCSEDYGSRPLMEALATILLLCDAKVVNSKTVYKALSDQHMFTDRRPEVVAKLCLLVKMIFKNTTELNFSDHQVIIVDALKTMWNLVSEFRHEMIVVAALDALSQFNVSLMPLNVLPEAYRKDVKIPSELMKKSNINNPPENVIPYVPGYLWVTYLQNVPENVKYNTCNMMSSWLQIELSQLGRGFYRSIRGEPNDVSFLPDKSIFKAFVKYLKRIVVTHVSCTEDVIKTVTLCFMVLNSDVVTQIPLFDWSFLNYYLKCRNNELTKEICQFFAKQSGMSTSANKCIEHYLKTLDIVSCRPEELRLILHVLPQLCRYITPTVFSNVIEPAFMKIFEICKNDKDFFGLTCDQLYVTLNESNLDEHNRDLVCCHVIKLWTEVTSENNAFVHLAGVIVQMPLTFIEHLIASEQCSAPSWEKTHKLMKLVYLMSMNENKAPFKWFHCLVDCAMTCSSAKKIIYVYSADILRKHRFHSDKWKWLLQFMHGMHREIEGSISEEKIEFLCEFVIFSIVMSSSVYPFLNNFESVHECMIFFPQAVRNITFDGISSQVIELLHFISKSKKIGDKFKAVFRNALIAMKYNVHLQKLSNWNKIISVF